MRIAFHFYNKSCSVSDTDMYLFLYIYTVFFCVSYSQEYSYRIVGGSPARDGQYPFVAAIFITKQAGRYFCGGALINESWVLTGGQCVDNALSFTIQLGSSTLESIDPNRQIFTSNTSYQHPDFNIKTLANDIGLIQLPQSVIFNNNLNIVNLPTEHLKDDSLTISMGWGQTGDGTGGMVDRLQDVSMIAIPNDICKNTYGEQIYETMMCTVGNFNEGICIGDTGSPLVAKEGNVYTHVGIASFLSDRGCESVDPSGYSRTYPYVEWIYRVIDENA